MHFLSPVLDLEGNVLQQQTYSVKNPATWGTFDIKPLVQTERTFWSLSGAPAAASAHCPGQ